MKRPANSTTEIYEESTHCSTATSLVWAAIFSHPENCNSLSTALLTSRQAKSLSIPYATTNVAFKKWELLKMFHLKYKFSDMLYIALHDLAPTHLPNLTLGYLPSLTAFHPHAHLLVPPNYPILGCCLWQLRWLRHIYFSKPFCSCPTEWRKLISANWFFFFYFQMWSDSLDIWCGQDSTGLESSVHEGVHWDGLWFPDFWPWRHAGHPCNEFLVPLPTLEQ